MAQDPNYTSYYDQYMANRAARDQERIKLASAGVPVENMGITGLSSAFDSLQAMIRDYKNSDEYKAKVAAKREERAAKEKNKEAVDKQIEGRDPNKKNTTKEETAEALRTNTTPKDPEVKINPSQNVTNYASFMPSANKMKSPMKYGRADATLIAGVRRMNQARNSVNVFQPIDDLVDRVRLMKQEVRKKANKELEQYSLEKTNDTFSTFKNGTNAATQYK